MIIPRDESTNPPFQASHPPPARDQRHELVEDEITTTTTTSPDTNTESKTADTESKDTESKDTESKDTESKDTESKNTKTESANPPFQISHPPPARDQRHELITTEKDDYVEPPFRATHPSTARDQRHELIDDGKSGLAPGAIAAIVIVVVLVFSAAGWVLYTCLRARRLGLPKPTWRSFIPNRRTKSNSTALEPNRPAAGGFMSRILPNRRGGYDGHSARMERLKEDQQVWNSEMRDREDTEYRGAFGNQDTELLREEEEMRRVYGGSDDTVQYAGDERGRSRGRDPPAAGGVQNVKAQQDRPRESFESRRSAFREGL